MTPTDIPSFDTAPASEYPPVPPIKRTRKRQLTPGKATHDARGNYVRARAAGVINDPSYPWDNTRLSGRVLSGQQLQLALQIIEMSARELGALFRSSDFKVWCWLNEPPNCAARNKLPRGVSDYVRLLVARRLKAIGIGTNTPVLTDWDYQSKPSDKALAALSEYTEKLTESQQDKLKQQVFDALIKQMMAEPHKLDEFKQAPKPGEDLSPPKPVYPRP